MEGYVTVEQMLEFREMKAAIQAELLRCCPGSVITALGMNIPGPKKTSEEIQAAFEAGVEALKETFCREGIHIIGQRSLVVQAGSLMFYALSCPGAAYVKKLTVYLEETHPLGRLFDIDVLWPDGKGISREALGLPKRRCFLCDQEAKICGRSRAHSVEELQQAVEEMITCWMENQPDSSMQTVKLVPSMRSKEMQTGSIASGMMQLSAEQGDNHGSNVQRNMGRSKIWQDSMRHNYAAQ
ncbi:MAG: citrate lyase holo-[acyl-carrier protein] synthase [Lachnospiraceae bacterium]|nr:citrate lyase holo-[acyl-carrier protein] synthase [Lachnospiraceae bacterium]